MKWFIILCTLDIVLAVSVCPPDDNTVFPQLVCSCVDAYVQCEDVTHWPVYSSTVELNELNISNSKDLNFTANMFKFLYVKKLILSDNNIDNSKLHPDTFSGLNVSEIDLSNNRLAQIPDALKIVTGLKGLDISRNFIDSLTNGNGDTIMRELGKTLTSFKFGSREITEWPKQLKHFPKLESLTVTKSSINLMPLDAFYGFEKTLRYLTVEYTRLRSVPLAIAYLDYLQELHFDHNTNVGDYGMNVPLVDSYLKHLGLMSLKDDNITTFPDVLGVFTNLSKVNMDGNELKFVSDKSATSIKNVTTLSLQNSGISRIPGALQDIRTLTNLDLSRNNIHSVEREDLRNLTKLKTLRLNDNPVLYISNDAFRNLGYMDTLELRNTNLTVIPCAINQLQLESYNVTVDLSGNNIDCTCSQRWVLDWKNKHQDHHLSILGDCETIDSKIQAYVDTALSTCPSSRGICN